MSNNRKSQYKTAPGLVKSEVIHQEPMFYFTFLSVVISTSALSSFSIIGAWLLKHISISHINSTVPSEKKVHLFSRHVFSRVQKHFPRSFPVAPPLHTICLNYTTCPCLNQLLARELQPAYLTLNHRGGKIPEQYPVFPGKEDGAKYMLGKSKSTCIVH